MDLRTIFQLRDKKFWWMDVIFYFALSLLIAAVFCYVLFLAKNAIQRQEIKEISSALETVGTGQQKEYEKSVVSYQKKIRDFSKLLENHEFASHVFNFMQEQTMSNIWFKQFTLDRKNKKVQLSGEADDIEAFSRQVAHFEKNEYVNSVGTLNSALGELARVDFNLNLALNPEIFSYVPETIPAEERFPLEAEAAQAPGDRDSQKSILVFDLLLNPEVVGTVDQESYTVAVDVPYGTDVTNIQPLIIASPGAKTSPLSGVFQNFTNPVTYTVTAIDGSSQKYTVKVNVLPETSAGSGQPSRSGNIFAVVIAILIVIAMALILSAVFLFFKKRSMNKKQAPVKNAN